MKINLLSVFFLLIYCLIVGCSTNISNNSLNIKVEFTKIDSWLNLMPLSGNKYYVAGEYTVKNNTDSTIKNLELKQIKIYQNKKLLYSFTPVVTDVTMLESAVLAPRQTRNYKFGTAPGLVQKSELDNEKNISLKFAFTAGDKFLELTTENIKIEKVY